MPRKKPVANKKEESDEASDRSETSPPKKKLTKNSSKGRLSRKKPINDPEDDFKVDNNVLSDDIEDVEEEYNLKKKLKSKKEDSDVEYKDDDGEGGIKPKLKRGKKSETKKNASKKASEKSDTKKTSPAANKKETTKSPKNGAKKGSKKEEQKSDNEEENAGTQSAEKDMLMDPENGMFNFQEDGVIDESNYYIPPWIQEANIRDENGRRPDDPGYDPSTLYIPEDELAKQTPLMQQYWGFKRKHFDKLVAMKLWKFYNFFYYDAFVAQRITDYKLNKWGKWTFLNFHETTMSKMSHKFLAQGHKLVIIEQMEETKQKDELVKREICQILTRGTAIESAEIDYTSRFMLAIFEENLRFGVVLCDTTTHEFLIGEFEDDENRANLRTLIMRTKPVEIVSMKSFIEQDTLNMLKALSTRPALSTVITNEPKCIADIFDTLRGYFTPKDQEEELNPKLEYPPLLNQIKISFETSLNNDPRASVSQGSQSIGQEKKMPFFFTMQALSICVEYLQNVLLAEVVVSMGSFSPFDLTIDKKSSLYLDSQALQNLEVLEVQYLNVFSETNSLFGYMDKTVTAFGKRMFKRWITSPLMNAEAIKERQDAVDDLIKNIDVVDYFREHLGKLPDIERMTNRIYNLSNKQRMSANYFEDFAKNRLKDFLAFLKELKKIEDLVETFKDYVPNFNSKRLIELTTLKDVDIQAFKERKKGSTGKKQKGRPTGIFPRINQIIGDLEGMVEMRDGQPMPAPGVNSESDEIVEKITEIKSILQDYLEKQRKKFHSNDIKYTHTKQRYELEIPEELVEGSKRPKEYAITSKRKGFLRFHTPDIENCLRKLHHYEYDFQKIFTPFICEYFKKFYERNSYWQQVISCLGELDCLCSLAQLAVTMDVKCRPEVLPASEKPIFELKDMVHPMAAKTNLNFVPNDVIVEDPVDTFLITGPNMGGKSTLLRQTCLAVIMAQVGSYIPARRFKLSCIDRIFTRVGASDRILEGKSTFFIEMEETYNIVKEATKNSLLIVDELGRGTSTYDGVSIAYGTLKYIVEHIGCITLFATHYHLLLEEFRLYKNMHTYFMDCQFNERKDEIKFLYKFVKGQASKSHGIVIAKMAGLPENVIRLAKEKESFMTKERRNIGFERNLLEKFHKTIDEMSKLENDQNYNVDKILHELNQIH